MKFPAIPLTIQGRAGAPRGLLTFFPTATQKLEMSNFMLRKIKT